ncbi:MAG: flagellar hook capping protein [Gemmatimonadales bacterium]|nr:MAG: flagellar hook capping protein [Gemmatimonadales bacterium]
MRRPAPRGTLRLGGRNAHRRHRRPATGQRDGGGARPIHRSHRAG